MKLDILSPYYWLLQLKELREIHSADYGVPVISVGNINTGGSGKTPFIQFLVGELKTKYPAKQILIISKSYKASLKNPQEVTTSDITRPDIFGDEPCLLKSLVDADVWSGPTKYKTLEAALKNKNYDLVIVDDGFSHRRIKRHLDIVLFDVSRSRAHYQIIPFGFMREPWSALKRSSLVVLTKHEMESSGKVQAFRRQIGRYQKEIIEVQFASQLQSTVKNVFVVAGIGNPDVLLQGLRKSGFNIVKSKLYPDHYGFSVEDQTQIWHDFQQLKTQMDVIVVTTAKDLIKFKCPDLLENIKTINLNVSMSNENLKVLHEKISALF